MSSVAVAILNYNGADHLSNFLPALCNYSDDAIIYVIDNASTDNSLAVIRSYPSVQLIPLKENHGFAEGYNLGLDQIEADYFILLNSDVEVTEHWITPMKDFLDNHPDYAACQPKVLDWNDRTKFEHAGAAGGFLDRLGYPFCRGRILNHIETDSGQYDDPADILWTSGACMMIRSEIFRKLGGFDPDLFAHMEEIDLCWRIYDSGKRSKCIPASVVYHVGGGTLAYGSPRKTYLNFRNSLIVLCKNLPLTDLFYVLVLRFGLDIMAGISMKSMTHFWSILKANYSFYRSFWKHFRKRTRPKRISKELKGDKWVLIQFFLRGKKTFLEIQ